MYGSDHAILGFSLIDIRNEVVRESTKVTAIVLKISQLKWQWTGLIFRKTDSRWRKKVEVFYKKSFTFIGHE